jgi:hypothetical protein
VSTPSAVGSFLLGGDKPVPITQASIEQAAVPSMGGIGRLAPTGRPSMSHCARLPWLSLPTAAM